MKRTAQTLLILLLSTGMSYAQSSKRTSAHNALEDFKRDKDPASLKKAKDFIDMASQHAETGVEAKTWNMRGEIYLTAYAAALLSEDEKQKDEKDAAKKNMVSYVNVPIADLQTAYESYVKTRDLDKKKVYTDEINKGLFIIGTHFENKGRADYNNKKALEAGGSFEKCFEISVLNGKMDTATLNYAALAYRVGGDAAKAKSIYQKLIDLGYGKGKTISILGTLLMNEKDTAAARKVISAGRVKYPTDMELLTTETNLFLMAHKNKEALANLKQVIEKNPNDAQLNLVVASVFDNMANPKDADDKELPKPAEYDQYYTQSESYYKKAIELKPDYFDALYNLGVLYNNQGVIMYNKANNIKNKAEADKEGNKADEIFKMAIPYLEKAHSVNPKDKNTMRSLKQLYAKTAQQEKYDKIKAELDATK